MKMTRICCLIVTLALCLALAACGNKSSVRSDIDIDMSVMGDNMVYAQAAQMAENPQDYVGKTVRAVGEYYSTYYAPTDENMFCIVFADVTACCSQSFEFVWDDNSHVYPDDYPAEKARVELTGVFDTYTTEQGMVCCRLLVDELRVL